MHVLIAGAGLGGPALALALARQGIRSTIYEIRERQSNAGGSITLTAGAIKVLDNSIGVYDKLKSAGYTYTRMGAHSEDGYRYGDVIVGDEKEGYPALRIMRSKLNEILLQQCQKLDGLVDVKWGAVTKAIREDDNGVKVQFENGSSVEGDILIGCDGIHSKVRDHIIPDNPPTPAFTGQCTINGFLPVADISLPEGCTLPFAVLTASGFVMAVPIDKEGTQAAWGITAETEQRDREGWREYEYSGQAARDGKALFKDVKTEPLRSVLDNAEESEARIWPHHTIGDVPSWHRGRICLLGDAAHALPPNGQGSALAFEDAAFLSRLLSSPSAVEMGYDRLFSHYESVRRERVRNIQRSAKSAGTVKKKTGPWVWYTKKWAFWAFFTWKGGELRMGHDKSYDVMKESINIQES